jgi:arylsulfatase A-like enzyme
MYANTLANVDRAIGRLMQMTTEALGAPPGVIVTSDHGESLFEEGLLGHGYVLDEIQTRIPLIVANVPMVIEQPWGQASLRRQLLGALAAGGEGSAESRPVVRQNPQGQVFQYLGTSDQPAVIGLRGATGRIQYDFRSRQVQEDTGPWIQSDRLPASAHERFVQLIRTWESLMLFRFGASGH